MEASTAKTDSAAPSPVASTPAGPSTPPPASAPRTEGPTRRVDFVSPQLAAALAHPTRVAVMGVLVEGPASPRQMAEAIDEPLNNVTYHVKQLRALGCIELDRTERRAGGRVLERFYRASQRAYFDDDAWAVLNPQERLGVIWSIVRMMSRDITTAMTAGTFFGDDYDVHATRSPVTVDKEGWEEIAELVNRSTKEIFEIERRVEKRQAEGGDAPDIHTKVQILQFRSPSPR
ncbi:MAG TPA: helix-turn-helix domain-containing protein [Solirubrobacterales bacterium]|nr:helix-turn-helix domain-containing protein [Solirubrobacterales bacterium]